MGKILTLGENMLRMSTVDGCRLANSNSFNLHYGGAEGNVAINLAQLGHEVSFATKLPKDNSLSGRIITEMQSHGVDCSKVLYGEGRLGTYYLEKGTGLRASKVMYDRSYSAISMMKTIEWDLDELFKDVSIFHITGITLALSKSWMDIGVELIKEAKKRNIKISFDMNYRNKMWPVEAAKKTYEKILPLVNYLSAGKLDAIHFMDIKEKEDADWQYYVEKIALQYPNIDYIYGTNRNLKTPNSYTMTGYLWDAQNKIGVESKEYKNYTVIDRVGTGDSYAAAVIDGIISNKNIQDIVNFAIASSALKHTVYGDINLFTRDEITEFMTNSKDIVR